MKQYAIIETWNGSGYSEENKLNQVIRTTEEEVSKLCKELAEEQIHLDGEIEERENGFIFEIEDDAGSFQYFEITDDVHGFLVLTNVNEVTVLDEEEFEYALNQSLENSDEDEVLYNDEKHIFIGAYEDEYDRQFIKL